MFSFDSFNVNFLNIEKVKKIIVCPIHQETVYKIVTTFMDRSSPNLEHIVFPCFTEEDIFEQFDRKLSINPVPFASDQCLKLYRPIFPIVPNKI